MARDNDVFQILIAKGNQAVLGADKTFDDLKHGQIGVFDADTNLSIDGTKPTRNVQIVVGVDADGDGVVDSINKSAGIFQTRHLNGYTFRPHTPAQAQIVQISDISATCDTDFAIKIQYEGVDIRRMQGAVPYSNSYVVRTGCCPQCGDVCNTADVNELIKKFVQKINSDPKAKVTASAWNTATNTVVTDIDAFIAANSAVNTDKDATNDVKLALRLTSKLSKVGPSNDINPDYTKMREVTFTASLAVGFGCGGKVETIQSAAFEEGNGADLKQREYEAGGWNGRPGVYRQSGPYGLPSKGFLYFADESAKYDKFVLEYQHEATGGWLDYKNDLATEIAVPVTDTVTRDSLAAVLDALATPKGFEALADDATAAVAAVTTAEPTAKKGKTKDGIA